MLKKELEDAEKKAQKELKEKQRLEIEMINKIREKTESKTIMQKFKSQIDRFLLFGRGNEDTHKDDKEDHK